MYGTVRATSRRVVGLEIAAAGAPQFPSGANCAPSSPNSMARKVDGCCAPDTGMARTSGELFPPCRRAIMPSSSGRLTLEPHAAALSSLSEEWYNVWGRIDSRTRRSLLWRNRSTT